MFDRDDGRLLAKCGVVLAASASVVLAIAATLGAAVTVFRLTAGAC